MSEENMNDNFDNMDDTMDTSNKTNTGFFAKIEQSTGLNVWMLFFIICCVCIICSICSSLVYYFSIPKATQSLPKEKTQFQITQDEMNKMINQKLLSNQPTLNSSFFN